MLNTPVQKLMTGTQWDSALYSAKLNIGIKIKECKKCIVYIVINAMEWIPGMVVCTPACKLLISYNIRKSSPIKGKNEEPS